MNSPEQVDLVAALIKLSELLKRFSSDVMSERAESHHWHRIADLLTESARQCRQQA